jgi:hypothetical protein
VSAFLCAGVRFVTRLVESRLPGRGPVGEVVVRHRATGATLRFEHEGQARRYLEQYCCEPHAFEVTPVDDVDDERAA